MRVAMLFQNFSETQVDESFKPPHISVKGILLNILSITEKRVISINEKNVLPFMIKRSDQIDCKTYRWSPEISFETRSGAS